MVDFEQYVDVTINRANRKGYREMGYECDFGDVISVQFKNLYRPRNQLRIKIVCDHCGKEYEMSLSNYNALMRQEDKRSFCKECAHIKNQEVTLKKYGVKTVFALPEMQQKIKEINLKKYGAEYITQTDSFKEQRAKTNLEKYGCVSPFGDKKVREKSQKTLQDNYGVSNPSQSKEIQEKIRQSFYQNNSQKVSKQQQAIFNCLDQNKFCLNYPLLRYNIDIADELQKIAIEYNGGGHNLQVKLGTITPSQFIQKETFRKKQLYKKGWKIITFISENKNLIPEEKECQKLVNSAYAYFNIENRHWAEFLLEERIVKTSQFSMSFEEFINKYFTVND